jgi:hypothetical protein
MKRLVYIVLLLLPSLAFGQVMRFGLVVGNNRGQERRAALRYAERDAKRFARLLVDLGGFEPENVVRLDGATAAEFREAFLDIQRKIADVVPRKAPRALLVVYFSGHSDGVNLELGSGLIEYAEFLRLVEESGAGIQIVFIDSCQSGGLIAVKGGRPGPSFDLVLTDTIDANGPAIVTSSAAGENSQESGELGGSFFTHYLLSGLRGAADANQDSRVTLAEVYQYAYQKTVVGTARTLSGTQHPTYEYQMEGRGNVVLTYLARGRARLRFGADTSGEFLVLSRDTGEVVAELEKPYGTSRQLAVPAGAYTIALRRGERLYSQEIALKDRGRVRVDPACMRERPALLASVKGSGPARSGVGMFLHYGLLSGALKNYAAIHQGIVGLRVDLGPTTLFPRFSYGEASIAAGQLDYFIRMYSLESVIAWRLEYSVLDLFGGILLGLSHGTQYLAEDQEFSGTIFTYGAVGGIDLPLVSGLALQIFWEAGARVFSLNDELSQQLSLQGVVGLGYEF